MRWPMTITSSRAYCRPENSEQLLAGWAHEAKAEPSFDWEDQEGVLAKVNEEWDELARADTPAKREAELGDLLFSIVNAARWMDIDAESALRGTTNRFRQRFRSMEQMAEKDGATLAELDLEAKEALWQRAKGAARAE